MDPSNTSEYLSILTVDELRTLCHGVLKLPRPIASQKSKIIHAIEGAGIEELQTAVFEAAKIKFEANFSKVQSHRKRRREEMRYTRRVVQKLEERTEPSNWENPHDITKFLDLPSDQEVKQCYRDFYNATSQQSIEMCICGVCGWEVGIQVDGVVHMRIADIPNGQRLIPKHPHPAHTLFDGKLFDPSGVYMGEDNIQYISVCRPCFGDLNQPGQANRRKDGTFKPPKFSLANNLWIGKIPWQLQILSFPEQLLISHLYCRVYVFKLFPKRGAGNDPSTLQRGMRGTVCTYDLDMEGVASMVSGNLMPRPPTILASLISVTFIGLGDLPKHWIRTTFRVRHQVVYEALCWLKNHNKKYYDTVQIDATQISALPEDDVPIEVMGIIRQSSDVGIVAQESAGYAPQFENEGVFSQF